MTGERSPLVSVVMPVYNAERYLTEAIESILAQTFTDFEFFIVDDGSEDKSAAIIREHADRDGRIRLIQLAEHSGVASARNAGLAAANGEFIANMDSDDISLPERLQKQVSFLQSNPEVGAVSVDSRVVYEDLRHRNNREAPRLHALILLDHYIGDPSFQHAAIMMRRDLVLAVGAYDLSLQYSIDLDLMTRLLGRTLFASIGEYLYIYRRRANQLSSHRNAKRNQDVQLVYQRRLERLWGEAPRETLDRFSRIKPFSRLSWRERRAAKRDITHLIESMIDAKWIEPGDRPLLINVMNRRLELVSPHLWQMCCHWYRYRIQNRLPFAKR